MKTSHSHYLKLAFNIAKTNLGKTSNNPSVGCVVVKNESVISSGVTSLKGRPHAEYNALKISKNFNKASLYVTMEPCTHFGQTPPCANLIKKKGIKNVFYSFNDLDKRTANKLEKNLKVKNIKCKKLFLNDFKDFYESYFSIHRKSIPYIDAKIAVSNDYLSISRKNKWITNLSSRKVAHLIRSEYDCIISTSKSINKDNSVLNCRLKGFDKSKPDVVIIDLELKIKKNLEIFKKNQNRKIFIVTTAFQKKNYSYLKKKGVKFIYVDSLSTKKDFISLVQILKKYNFNRILVESGLIFTGFLIKKKLINNLYLFKSPYNLKCMGYNNTSSKYLKNMSLKNKIKVNLHGDNLYKIKIK